MLFNLQREFIRSSQVGKFEVLSKVLKRVWYAGMCWCMANAEKHLKSAASGVFPPWNGSLAILVSHSFKRLMKVSSCSFLWDFEMKNFPSVNEYQNNLKIFHKYLKMISLAISVLNSVTKCFDFVKNCHLYQIDWFNVLI